MNRDSNPRAAGLMQRRSFVAAALPLALGLSSLAHAQEKTAIEKIRASGVLKIALYKENEPYSDGNMSHMAGLDVSLGEALAKALQLLKGNSSKWLRETYPELLRDDFAWQEGYGAFSIGVSGIADTIQYIHGQAEHHRQRSFREELEAFLTKHGITPDPKLLD